MVKGLLLDLNRVAEDYSQFERSLPEVIANACRTLAKRFDTTESTLHTLCSTFLAFGNGGPIQHHPGFWQHVLELALGRALAYDEIEEAYGVYLAEYLLRIRLYPDFLPLAKEARMRGCQVGIVSNANQRRVYKLFDKFDMRGAFDTVVVSNATPFQKPAPELFRLALMNLRLGPFEAAFVGDRVDTDVRGANAAGLWSILLDRDGSYKAESSSHLNTPDFVVHNLNEVVGLVNNRGCRRIDTAVIVCGGRGSRMGALADDRQKCMMPLRGRPILALMIELLQGFGLTDFRLLVGYRSDDIKNYFGDGSSLGIKITYEHTGAASTGSAVTCILESLPDRFVYSHGDILLSAGQISATLKRAYRTTRASFCATRAAIAPTHPGFVVNGASVASIRRSPSHDAGEDFLFSVGLGVAVKSSLLVQTGSPTMEELLNPHFVELVETLEPWVHFESPADLTRQSVG